MLINDKSQNKSFKAIMINLGIAFLTLSFFVGIIFAFLPLKKPTNLNNFHILINSNSGYADKGFGQKTIEGVCLSLDIKSEDCESSNSYFKSNQIAYGYPNTMENVIQIEKYINNFIKLENTDNFVLPGFTYSCFLFDKMNSYQDDNEIKKLSSSIKKINFISIDANIRHCSKIKSEKDYQERYPVWPKNLYQINFKHYISGYHAGLYAGMKALKNPENFKDADPNTPGKQIHFGILGGIWITPIKRYAIGFAKALEVIEQNKKVLKPETEVSVKLVDYQTIGGFDVLEYSERTQELSKYQYEIKKISVIFNIAVSLTKSVNISAQEANIKAKNKHHWVIGVDIDQGVSILNENSESSEIKGQILTSAILEIDQAIKKIIQDYIFKNIDATAEYIFMEEKFASIPQRFKNTDIWKAIISNLSTLNLMNISSVQIEEWDQSLNNLNEKMFQAQLKNE